MPHVLTKIGLVLLLVFLLPAIYYSVRELRAVQESELIIEERYNNQLEAILFSVNQYSEDIVRSWTQEWNALERDSLRDDSVAVGQFFSENYAIREVFMLDSLTASALSFYCDPSRPEPLSRADLIVRQIEEQQTTLRRLFNYRAQGYLKIQPIVADTSGLQLLVFLADGADTNRSVHGFVLDAEVFINDFLGPRMHAIAQEDFVISVHQQAEAMPRYTTANHPKHGMSWEPRKALWLFPDYTLTIRLGEEDQLSLAKQRFRSNLFLIVGLNAVLLLGAWFVFRTIKKEIELAQIKSDFVSNVSHEIRTPLALINMFSETLLMGRAKSEEKKQEYYRIVHHEAQRLTSMVNKILSFSKMEAGHHFDLQPIDLDEVVAAVLESYDYHLRSEGFTYEWHPAGKGLTISGDREAIAEALINLLDNAIKYSEDRKHIIIRTGKHEGCCFVEIQDQGIGISEANQKAIFEKFFRVSGDSSSRKGTGLGLSLVKHIMDAHKGRVELTSHLREGSVFRLNFPIRYRVSKLVTNA